MKHIVAAIILLLAAPLMAGEPLRQSEAPTSRLAESQPLPVLYECNADEGVVLEEEFCSDFKAALIRSENVIFCDKTRESYFRLTILPAAREGYLGVLITSNYVTPPFKPLELSAFSGIWMVSPGTDRVMLSNGIAGTTLKGTFDWIEWARRRPVPDDPREVVVRLGGVDDD